MALAAIAGVVWLADVGPAANALAGAMAVLFAALALMAAITGAFGRGRDGLYSGERALATVGVSLGLAGLGFVWVERGWSAADAGRALDQSASVLANLAADIL